MVQEYYIIFKTRCEFKFNVTTNKINIKYIIKRYNNKPTFAHNKLISSNLISRFPAVLNVNCQTTDNDNVRWHRQCPLCLSRACLTICGNKCIACSCTIHFLRSLYYIFPFGINIFCIKLYYLI